MDRCRTRTALRFCASCPLPSPLPLPRGTLPLGPRQAIARETALLRQTAQHKIDTQRAAALAALKPIKTARGRIGRLNADQRKRRRTELRRLVVLAGADPEEASVRGLSEAERERTLAALDRLKAAGPLGGLGASASAPV